MNDGYDIEWGHNDRAEWEWEWAWAGDAIHTYGDRYDMIWYNILDHQKKKRRGKEGFLR